MREEVDTGWWDPALFEILSQLVGEEGFQLPEEETRAQVRAAVSGS